MTISEEKFERLQRFLEGSMTLQEIQLLEQELANDPAMQQQLDFLVKMTQLNTEAASEGTASDDTMRAMLLMAKQNHLGSVVPLVKSNDAVADKTKVIPVSRSYWLAVASVIILAFIAILMYQVGKNKHPDPIVKHPVDTLEKAPLVIIDTNGKQLPKKESPVKINYAALADAYYKKDLATTDLPQQIEAEVNDYKAGHYTSIQELDIDKIEKSRGAEDINEIRLTARYYKALSLIETKNYESAMIELKRVISGTSSKFLKVKSQWYMALVNLKMNQPSAADALLKTLAADQSAAEYKSKAVELIKKMAP